LVEHLSADIQYVISVPRNGWNRWNAWNGWNTPPLTKFCQHFFHYHSLLPQASRLWPAFRSYHPHAIPIQKAANYSIENCFGTRNGIGAKEAIKKPCHCERSAAISSPLLYRQCLTVMYSDEIASSFRPRNDINELSTFPSANKLRAKFDKNHDKRPGKTGTPYHFFCLIHTTC
jgi:hypothetical protein